MNITENVMFGDYKSYDDFGLILKGKSISAPSPKVNKVDVSGRNGSIDFTDALGGVRYENRKITMRFLIKEIDFDLITAKMSRIMMALHGQEKHIIFADDEAYYWKGRLTVGDYKLSKGFNPYVTFNITADVEPYKYSIYTTDEDWLWNPFDFENGIVNQLSDVIVHPNKEERVYIVTYPDDRVTAPVVTCDSETDAYLKPMVKENGEWVNMTDAPIKIHKGSQVLYSVPFEKGKEYLLLLRNADDKKAIIFSINYYGGSL